MHDNVGNGIVLGALISLLELIRYLLQLMG
ncbi:MULTISPECIES: damage-inducible type I toxin DinQ [Enterobacteriaceae]